MKAGQIGIAAKRRQNLPMAVTAAERRKNVATAARPWNKNRTCISPVRGVRILRRYAADLAVNRNHGLRPWLHSAAATRLWMLFILVCLAQPAFAADKWISIQSRNFLLVGNAEESEIRRLGRTLEEFRSALAMMFPRMDQASSIQTTVLVFKDEASFAPYRPGNAVAFFQPGEDVNYIGITASIASPNAVLHEYVHFLTRENLTGLPVWASEGLAEVYSTFELNGRGNEFTIGRAPERHVKTLTSAPLIPLKRLFEIQHGSPEYNEQSKQGMFYAESWAVVHYLILGGEGKRRAQFVQFLTALAQGQPFDDSFGDAFQTDYGTLMDEVVAYANKRSTWPSLKATSKQSLQVDVRSIKPVALSEAETEAYLGDLLLHMNRLPDAEKHLNAAIAKTPTLISAQASLGVLFVRQKKYDEALAMLKKAVDADSKNHIVNFYYAYALERVDSDTAAGAGATDRYETMRTYAKKAIDLGPRFVEGYALLARLNLTNGENIAENEATLKKALSISPGREDIHLLLAQSYLRGDRLADARSVLSNLERVSNDPDVRKRATALLDQTEQTTTFGEITPAIQKEIQKDLKAEAEKQQAAAPRPAPPPVSTRQDTVLEALTPLGPTVEGEKVTGLLTLLECSNGLTLRVRTDQNTLDFHSIEPEKIQFLSYTADVTTEIRCGPRNPGTPVTITFKPATGGRRDPLVVEFLEVKK